MDKDVKTARTIFKEKWEKHDHVNYEHRVWKGEMLFPVMSI